MRLLAVHCTDSW